MSMIANLLPTPSSHIKGLRSDLNVRACLMELIDNSIDAGSSEIDVTVNDTEIVISDNGAGISSAKIEDVLLRFGKVDDSHEETSIGNFGQGLLRALVTLGNTCRIDTVHADGSFSIPLSVTEIEQSENTWTLPVEALTVEQSATGTTIDVRDLEPRTFTEVRSISFDLDLMGQLGLRYGHLIQDKPLCITVNGASVEAILPTLKTDTPFPSLVKRLEIDDVTVTLTIGEHAEYENRGKSTKSKLSVKDYGWHVYCQGRGVLHHEISPTVGWKVSRFHSDYFGLVGIAEFEGPSEKMPWNSDKQGVRESSSIYTEVLEVMEVMNKAWRKYCRKRKNRLQDSPILTPNPSQILSPTPTGRGSNQATPKINPMRQRGDSPTTDGNDSKLTELPLNTKPLAPYLEHETLCLESDFNSLAPADDPKIRQILFELSRTTLQESPLSVAFLMRALIELSALRYIRVMKVQNPGKDPKLATWVEVCRDHLFNNDHIDKSVKEVTTDAIGKTSEASDHFTIRRLQTSLHNYGSIPDGATLLSFWSSLRPYLVQVLAVPSYRSRT
ncbi:hypothetical protein G7066_11510 [Leucobacter coleopterorum]|uniref:Histidine kinase/HSP90-like ATPase domain-containing protein n=1 Tax=Leucobacter coleopterorum TaxID=2714933 RepID=A0ABX6JXU1_9MICO|nr:ATP-binding protein [Leucobacter coleopterorum]QIM19037.1 hypothetical protein G7066_11510 [Leucobacter coleopterorum]